jgi:hypothetical protein
MKQVTIEIDGGDSCCRAGINSYNQVSRFTRQRAEPDPLEAFATDPNLDIGTTVC